jgi:organic hydroperoxide reductase OsmC/OhrA
MPGDLSDSTARLAQLVRQIMKEPDPLRFDELGGEIWRVLDERECRTRYSVAEQRIEHAYRVDAWWASGRSGIAKSDSAPNAIHFTAPTEFGGLEGCWTPEELLLAALAGCLTTTLRAIAGVQFSLTDLQVEANGIVRKAASGYSFSEIVVRPTLKIADLSEREQALQILKRAESLCLVARALATPLRFEPEIEVRHGVVPA